MDKIIRRYKRYHPNPNVDLITKSYDFAKIIYHGEHRLNGEDWMEYILKVVRLIIELKMDTSTICAALLYDAYRFGVTPEEIEKEISVEVREILDSTEDIRRISKNYDVSKMDASYSDYLRRLILTTGRDIRVIVLRLAQKYVSLESLDALGQEKKIINLNKALHIYAPLAHLLGVGYLQRLIQETAFELRDPERFVMYTEMLSSHSHYERPRINSFIKEIKKLLIKNKIRYITVKGRAKGKYSFYKKVYRYSDKFEIEHDEAAEIVRDKVAFMILLKSTGDCYKALDALHKKYNHLPKELDDYISVPKKNGYRSLQTVLELEPGHFVEVQIKTRDMHDYNEFGPASHIYYKIHGDQKSVSEKKISMLQSLLQWQESLLTDKEKNTTKVDDFESEVLVFTPHGDLINIPKGGTPIDFAYAVHSDIGKRAVRAMVNGKLKPLDYELESGDVVFIVTDKSRTKPNPDWLDFVKSKKARFEIKKSHYFSKKTKLDLKG